MFLRDETVLYVGKAKNLRKRVSQYFTGAPTPRTKAMVAKATDLRWTVCASETEALVLEQQWISAHQPPYNVLMKYGSGYAGVAISTESTPRLFTWRGERPHKSKSFGPYPGVRSRELINALSLAFGVRTCSKGVFNKAKRSGVPCILADTGHCLAPCVDRVSELQYSTAVEQLRSFLQGRTASVLDKLTEEMSDSAANLEFEKAALVRDRLAALERTLQKQVMNEAGTWSGTCIEVHKGARIGIAVAVLARGRVMSVEAASLTAKEALDAQDALEEFMRQHDHLTDPAPISSTKSHHTRPPKGPRETAVSSFTANQARNAALYGGHEATSKSSVDELDELVLALNLKERPRRIEALDVSHTGGRHPVAAFAVVIDGELARDQVRYVNVPQGGDDLAGIAHATAKRFNGAQLGLQDQPDILLIDGGPLQVAAAAQLVPPRIETVVVGIAKRLEELWIPGTDDPLVLPRSGGLRLLMAARDHAHTLALRKHSATRDAALVRTEISSVPHIGPRRLAKLTAAFGSADAIVGATREQFQSVLGRAVGGQAWDNLHANTPNSTPQRPPQGT